MKITHSAVRLLSVLIPLLAWPLGQARAQWITQSFELKAGWNGVYLHVDASHATLAELVGQDTGNPIQEVWLWKPANATLQFVDSPQLPTGSGTQWASWVRTLGPSSDLQRLIGNAAYLVRVDSAVTTYTWRLKGKPTPPRYHWTSTGLNLLGFPTPGVNPPSFEEFLAKQPELHRNAEIYRYGGGELGVNNPARLFALRNYPLPRGEAFWIRAGETFNRYFGPFELDLQNPNGADFGTALGQYRIRLRNLTSGDLIVSLQLIPSEGPPAGQQSVTDVPPLLLRGVLNSTNLTYAYTNLAAARSWVLSAQGQTGAEVDVVLGVDRSVMSGAAGDLYAGVLRFTDSATLSQIDVPVSATVGSKAGLWIGEASVTRVQHYLKMFEKDASGKPVTSSGGQYILSGVNTNLGATARAFPLRLIVHSDAAGTNAALLQRVYYGIGLDTNLVVATRQELLHREYLSKARRISATHLPWTAGNTFWPFTGKLTAGTNAIATVGIGYDDQAGNPFLHTYHPDHDNRDATFRQILPQGDESYGIIREIRLALTAPADDFSSRTSGGDTFVGEYEETISLRGQGSESRQFQLRGAFSLNRITDIPSLTTE